MRRTKREQIRLQMEDLAERFAIVQTPTESERKRFADLCRSTEERVKNRDEFKGIGLLAEKTLHAVFKDFYEPDPHRQEVPIGPLVADICTGRHIIEIQATSLSGMHAKLDAYLADDYTVCIVLPMLFEKKLIWIRPDTGECSAPRKAPRSASIYTAVRELMRIRPYLADPRVTVDLCFITATEYRLLNGESKRGSRRLELLPTDLHRIVSLTIPGDYRIFLPENLPAPFRSTDLAERAGISRSAASTCLTMLTQLQIVKRVGKQGRSFLYEKIPV